MPIPERRRGNHHRYDGIAEDASEEADFTVKPLERCQAMRKKHSGFISEGYVCSLAFRVNTHLA